MREYHKPALCHPDKRHAAKGLCFSCYSKKYPSAKRANCHPDRIHQAGGLCNTCCMREIKKNNPEFAAKQAANQARWVIANKHRLQANRKTYRNQPRRKGIDTARNRMRELARYGLTWEDELAILDGQGWVCAICAQKPQRARFDIDHDHETGEFRGLICGRCNKGLGLLGDTVEALNRAISYLQNSPAGLVIEQELEKKMMIEIVNPYITLALGLYGREAVNAALKPPRYVPKNYTIADAPKPLEENGT